MSRILLLLAQRANRRLLAQSLAPNYEVVLPDEPGALEDAFDLGIIDGPALHQMGPWVRAVKQAEQPVFLPFLFLTHRQGVGMVTRHLWETVDELLVSPIEKAELQARVEILLRARQLSLENAVLTNRLETEMARAAAVQTELLPREAPALPGFELAGRCRPARETGGDFYDWQEIAPGMITLKVGDVMGKGMPAALLMATVRATLRAVARQNSPAAALELARQALQDDLQRAGSFVTLFLARLNGHTGRLRYVDAGHGHAFVLHADGKVRTLAQGGWPLGVGDGSAYEQRTVTLHEGDSLVIYSDGLVDAQPGKEVGPAILARHLRGADTAADMVRRLVALADRAATLPDDLTVVALRCTQEPARSKGAPRKPISSGESA